MSIVDFNIAKESYFAASNGYGGFTSFFPRIFAPEELTRLFIIKGGPGTGKSSFMKKLALFGTENGCHTEAIFCSSDPSSLDGIILSKNGKRIAFIDGTAPHATDAKFPGASDELIDLGAGFDRELLEGNRKEIIELNKEKGAAYSTAYSTLKAAGELNDVKRRFYENNVDYNAAESIINSIIKENENTASDKKRMIFLSSFGKNGYFKISFQLKEGVKKIAVYGNGHTEFILMNMLKNKLKNSIKTLCLSPLRVTDIEAIQTNNLFIYVDKNGDVDSEIISKKTDNFDKLTEVENESLNLARHYFSIASEAHFKLEDVYITAMNFENNDRLFEKYGNYCEKYLLL